MNSLFLILNDVDPGTINIKAQAHWAYYIGAVICILLLILTGWLTYKAFINKTNYYDLESDKLYWLKNFWHKNRIGFWIMIDIILFACIIVFFMAGAGALQ